MCCRHVAGDAGSRAVDPVRGRGRFPAGHQEGTDKVVLATCVLLLVLASSVLSAQSPLDRLTIIAPAAPGGGWDQLAREMQRTLEVERLVPSVQVENVPGAAGTIGLAQFVDNRRGDGQALLVNGLVMVGAILWNESPVSIAQATPIARLTGEHEIVAVPSASPHRDMQSLMRAIRENPAGVSWGGGSAGGTDHILAGLIVAAAKVDPRRTNYIAFSGGGEAVTALLGGQLTAGISGYSEFAQHIESGRLRAIGVSARSRLAGLDIPTLIEQGIEIELENWRAVVAPPGLRADQSAALISLLERMVQTPSWQATLTRLGWTDSYLAGPAFAEFLDAERVRVARIVSRLRGTTGPSSAARVGEWIFPGLVLGAMAVVVVALFAGRRRVPSEPSANRTGVIRVAVGLACFAGLLNIAGFVPAGTLLFAFTAAGFGSGRWLRNALVGFTLCAVVYVTFTYGLGVRLP
ncbi:MAG TPA: tripartite tricarboxylate transporter substrate-binding protein [Vicinamibacterales bacterium]|nr:tripartite tricarboxylate transporter substrate-binding protein [Vicinamibacterales bacterium]